MKEKSKQRAELRDVTNDKRSRLSAVSRNPPVTSAQWSRFVTGSDPIGVSERRCLSSDRAKSEAWRLKTQTRSFRLLSLML